MDIIDNCDCGNKPIIREYYIKGVANRKNYFLKCENCRTRTRHRKTKDKAIEEWNTYKGELFMKERKSQIGKEEKAIEILKETQDSYLKDELDLAIETVLNLINKQKETIKELEKQVKKYNKEAQQYFDTTVEQALRFDKDIQDNYISKDKIKEKIEELLNSYMKVVKIEDTTMANIHNEKIDNQIKILQELLEDDKNE